MADEKTNSQGKIDTKGLIVAQSPADKDWLLCSFVEFANRKGIEVDVTLSIGGAGVRDNYQWQDLF